MPNDTNAKKPSTSVSVHELLANLKSLARHLDPHVGFLYAVILLLGLTWCVYLVGQTLHSESLGSQNSAKTQIYSTRFDDKIVEKVRQLQAEPGQSAPIVLPEGRINPFAE